MLGYFCPIGTGTVIPECPMGTYGSSKRLESEDDCQDCDAGMYCDATKLTGPVGMCSAGFYCSNGSSSKTPPDDGLFLC